MATKIDQKIVNCSVVKGDSPIKKEGCTYCEGGECVKKAAGPIELPDSLSGSRYRLRSPIHAGSLYMIVMNDKIDGVLRPVEVFFEAKNMESYPWIKFTARLLSALFRQHGPFPSFVIDEMLQTSAPNGSYWLPKGEGQVSSIVHHAGLVLKKHCEALGLLETAMDEVQTAFVEKKKAELGVEGDDYPDYATVCGKCGEKAVVLMDGCQTCLSCSDSKCG